MRHLKAILGIACLVATAACGGEGVSPNDGTTPSDTVMEAPKAFVATPQGLTVESKWECTQAATWGVNAIAEDMESPMVVFDTMALNAAFTLPEVFVGKMVTLWVQRLDSQQQPFGPKSNRVVVGPIKPPVQEDMMPINDAPWLCYAGSYSRCVNDVSHLRGTANCTAMSGKFGCAGLFDALPYDSDRLTFDGCSRFQIKDPDGSILTCER